MSESISAVARQRTRNQPPCRGSEWPVLFYPGQPTPIPRRLPHRHRVRSVERQSKPPAPTGHAEPPTVTLLSPIWKPPERTQRPHNC